MAVLGQDNNKGDSGVVVYRPDGVTSPYTTGKDMKEFVQESLKDSANVQNVIERAIKHVPGYYPGVQTNMSTPGQTVVADDDAEADAEPGANMDYVASIERKIPDEFKVNNYDDVIKELETRRDKFKPMSDEELAKLRRKQRAEGIISGVSDAVRSIANMIAVHHYAPNMYDANNTMSARAQERFEKEKAEREANDDKYYNYAMTIAKLKEQDKANGLNVFNMEYQMSRDALADMIRASAEERAQLKADKDAALADLKAKLMEGKITKQEAEIKAAEIENQYADKYYQARIDGMKAKAFKDRHNAFKPKGGNSSGGKRSSGGSSSSGMWSAVDANGKVHDFPAKSEAQAHSYAGGKGWTLIGSTNTSSTNKDDGYGIKSTSSTTSTRTTNAVKPKSKKSIGW